MARRRLLVDENETEINLSPMIDCIFILLIFFIVTTVFVEEDGFQVAKPDAAAVASFEESENVVLEITQQDQILLNGKKISVADVPERIKANLNEPGTPVVIRAHEKSTHAAFVSVWDAALRGGAITLSFNTVN